MKQSLRYSKTALVVLLCTSAFIGLLRFNSFQVGAFSDDAHYIVLAESLANGQGYRLINYPDAPAEWAFPPGWPILLSPLVAFFPGNYAILKLVSFALWLASIPLMYRFFGKRIETPYLEILIALIALNPGMLGASAMVMSEAAYLFFSLLTLLLFELWDSHRDKAMGWLFFIAFVIAALYTQLIRTVGLSILLTLIAYLLLSHRFRQAGIVVIIASLGMLPQFWLNSKNGGSLISSGYQAQVLSNSIGTKLGQVWANAQAYSDGMIANSLIPIFGPNVESALNKLGIELIFSFANLFVLILITIGFILSLKHFRISVLYVFFYFMGILAFWNPSVGSAQARFLIPIIPFLCFYFLQSLIWSVRTVAKAEKPTVLVVAGLSSLIVLIFLARNLQDWHSPIRYRITDLSIGTAWVSEHTPSTSVIMARDPVPDYLYTRRRTVAYPTADEQDIEEYIRANGIDYIIVSPKLQTPRSDDLGDYVETRLLPVFSLHQDKFRPVYTNTAHNVTVYDYRSNP